MEASAVVVALDAAEERGRCLLPGLEVGIEDELLLERREDSALAYWSRGRSGRGRGARRGGFEGTTGARHARPRLRKDLEEQPQEQALGRRWPRSSSALGRRPTTPWTPSASSSPRRYFGTSDDATRPRGAVIKYSLALTHVSPFRRPSWSEPVSVFALVGRRSGAGAGAAGGISCKLP